MLPIPTKWLLALAGAALITTLLTLAFCQGKQSGKTGEVVKQQQREIETQVDLGHAADNSATFRIEDARTLDQQERDLRDAVKDAKSSDDARTKRGCAILRQQGRDTKNIPACR